MSSLRLFASQTFGRLSHRVRSAAGVHTLTTGRYDYLHGKRYDESHNILCNCGQPLSSTLLSRGMSQSRKKQPKQAADKEKWVSRSARQSGKNEPKVREIPEHYTKYLSRTCENDVYIKTYYPPVKYSLDEAINMHRELAVPEMLNNPSGLVVLSAELNMRTNKKTKFVGTFEGIVSLPHNFDDGVENKVLVFCKTKDEQRLALDQGAAFAGGSELVALIEGGEVRTYMFDHAVCTINFVEEITRVRKHIREKFPNPRAGAVGDDITALIKAFRFGKNYTCTKPFEDVGKITVNIGRLDMPNEQIIENFNTYVAKINGHRSGQRSKGMSSPFIVKAYCLCPPSGEKIYIRDEELTVQKTKESKAPTVADIEEHDDDDDDDAEEQAVSGGK